MKTIFLNRTMSRYVLMFFMLILLSCSKDREGIVDGTRLEERIVDAELILSTSEEGVEQGDFAPGAKQILKDRVDWARMILTTAVREEAIVNAEEILAKAIETFHTNVVKSGVPLYGKGAYFRYGTFGDFNITGQFSISCSVRFSSFGSDALGNIFVVGLDGAEAVILRYTKDGKIEAYVNNGGWLGGGLDSAPLQLDKWYHLSLTYSGKDLIAYLDGDIVLNLKGDGKPLAVAANFFVQSGVNPGYTSRFMLGNIIDVSIWNVVRSPMQVQGDYENGVELGSEGLVAHWPLDVNLGNSILDRTGKYTAKGTAINWQDK